MSHLGNEKEYCLISLEANRNKTKSAHPDFVTD